MADGVWKGIYPWVLGRSRQLSLNKFFDTSTPSMRKVDDGEEKKKKRKTKKKKIMTFIVATNVIASRLPERRPTGTPHARAKRKKRMAFLVATTSLPAVYRPNDDRWNAASSCQLLCRHKSGEEQRQLELQLQVPRNTTN